MARKPKIMREVPHEEELLLFERDFYCLTPHG